MKLPYNLSGLGYTAPVASKMIDGALFLVPSNDHLPRHLHVLIGDIAIIVDLLPGGLVQLSDRKDAKRPLNAKKSDVKKGLRLAKKNHSTLVALWEGVHGNKTN